MGPTATKAKCIMTEKNGVVYVLIQLSNKLIASGINNYIQIWDLRGNNNKASSILIGHTDSVSSLLELREKKQLISGSCDNSMRIWNLTNHQCESIINVHIWNISCIIELSFNRLITSSWDHSIKLWNTDTLKSINYEEHSEAITALLLLDDGRLVSGGDDSIIILWNINTRTINIDDKDTDNNLPMRLFHKLMGHSQQISCLVLLKNDTFASASFDGSIRLWDIDDLTCVSSFQMNDDNSILSLIQLNTGELIAGLGSDEIVILNIDPSNYSMKQLSTIEEHYDGVTALLQYKTAKNENIIIISGSYDSCMKVWQF